MCSDREDIRHFSRRGFAFVQFHSVEERLQLVILTEIVRQEP